MGAWVSVIQVGERASSVLMFTRKVSGSFVCLQCRLQLRGAALRGRPFAASAAARSQNHAPERQRPPADAKTGARQEIETTDTGHGAPTHNIEVTIEAQPSVDPFAALEESNEGEKRLERAAGETTGYGEETRQPLNMRRYASSSRRYGARDKLLLSPVRKVYQSRGKRLLAKKEALPIEILGKPGAAIILRERGAIKRGDLEQLEAEELPETNGRLAESLENESADPGGDDALVNIHNMKPRESQMLSESEFVALKDALMQGFTRAQLESYISEFDSAAEQLEQREHQSRVPRPPWVLEQREWRPIAADSFEAKGGKLQGYVAKSTTPKERVVLQLMRECWDVTCQTVLEGQGYLEAKLRDTEFALLTRMALQNHRILLQSPG